MDDDDDHDIFSTIFYISYKKSFLEIKSR